MSRPVSNLRTARLILWGLLGLGVTSFAAAGAWQWGAEAHQIARKRSHRNSISARRRKRVEDAEEVAEPQEAVA